MYGQTSEGLFSEVNKPFEAFQLSRVSNIAKQYLEGFCLSRQDYFMHFENPFFFFFPALWNLVYSL